LPVFLQLKHLKESYEAEDMILNTLKNEASEVSKDAEALFSGAKEIPKDLMGKIKGFVDAGKKANSNRVARRYYLSSLDPTLFY